MAQRHTSDCCKRSVEAVSEVKLCCVCETFQTFTAIIKEETDLDDEDAKMRSTWPAYLQTISFLQSLSACRRRIRRSSKTCFKRRSGGSSHTSLPVFNVQLC